MIEKTDRRRPEPHQCWSCVYWTGPGGPAGCWRPGSRSRSWLRDGCLAMDRCRHWSDAIPESIRKDAEEFERKCIEQERQDQEQREEEQRQQEQQSRDGSAGGQA